MKLGTLAVLVGALVAWFAAASGNPQADNAALKAKVRDLLEQMERGTANAKDAAEWDLLRLGPDALPYIPKTSAKLADRLPALLAALEETRPRTWTQPRVQMPLKEALQRLTEHTGQELVDRRQGGSDSPVTLDFNAATFWQAVQSLAEQTKARLSLYQPDGQAALVDGANPRLPQSLHGPFRVVVKRVALASDLEAGTHVCGVGLEIAWEPRLAPYLIEAGPASVTAGKAFATQLPSRGQVQVVERNAKEFDVLFAAPPRAAAKIDTLSGRFVVTVPAATHHFKKLIEKVPQTAGGVKVTVSRIVEDKQRWTVEMTIEHPAAGPKFESFQMWLGNNAWLDATSCYFERGAGENRKVLHPDSLRTHKLSASATHVSVRYQFAAQPGGREPWRLACRTPGRMVEMTVPYEFKDVPLP